MKELVPGTNLDGFVVRDCIHSGSMAYIYRVEYADGASPASFPMVMKVPHMSAGDAESLVSFEVELQLYPVLAGPHVARFVAAGDLARMPYLVIEHVEGQPLQHWVERHERHGDATVAELGDAIARAAHSLHQQNVCHLDLKPTNVLIRPDGSAVLLDFGLSHHAHYPDLLAEEMRTAIGSPAWIAPEQIVGVRGDLRSDIFAIGVMLYELATGELPFGAPTTRGGMRQRLWMTPAPPRRYRPDIAPWLQEIILRCLEPMAEQRYPSAAQLAFDLTHADQVPLTERATRTRGAGLRVHLMRWLRAAGMEYRPSPIPTRQIEEAPIVMVAMPYREVSDTTLYSLRAAAERSLRLRPGARLMCVTVVPPAQGDASLSRRLLAQLKQWAQPLEAPDHGVSHHVIEAGDVAQALIRYAAANNVSLMILGAATHGLKTQRFIATVPMRVARDAPCTVILVKQQLPFAELDNTADA
ncbi:protein kinase [Uliginosibacterium sp. sgz301328]|uniref:protein kinase domain-containing protein n=1 Tax=Uliginosibacterium sp. sgz301328 TaxID=3243764 RepID=UPI00359DEFDF